MTDLHRLTMTDDIRARIQAVKDALAVYQTGRDDRGYTEIVELPKLALAEAVLHAVAEQTAAHDAQIAAVPTKAAIARLPTRRRRA